jgi:hypothetical protein
MDPDFPNTSQCICARCIDINYHGGAPKSVGRRAADIYRDAYAGLDGLALGEARTTLALSITLEVIQKLTRI